MRKKFLPIYEVFEKLHHNRFTTWIDRVSFPYVLLFWVSVIIMFGLAYHALSNDVSYLYSNREHIPVKQALDAIYFSFSTATSTGFGDIVPSGYFKLIAIVEVISGLLLLAFVTSKLVSLKQDIILNEIYEISFQERINRLRSSLLLFRQHLGRIINRIDDQSIHKREINETYIYVSSLEDTLNEIVTLVDRDKKYHFTKDIDEINAELIVNSMNSSFEKLREFIGVCSQHQLEWKRDVTVSIIERCLMINETIFSKFPVSLSEKRMGDLRGQNRNITIMIQTEIQRR